MTYFGIYNADGTLYLDGATADSTGFYTLQDSKAEVFAVKFRPGCASIIIAEEYIISEIVLDNTDASFSGITQGRTRKNSKWWNYVLKVGGGGG